MESSKKTKLIPAADWEKAISKSIKSAVFSLTQTIDDATATGCMCKKIIQLKPAQVTALTYDDIARILREQMPLTPNASIKICDAFVTTYPNEVFMKFMDYATLRHAGEYEAEQYDCDDFSLTFCACAHKWHARIRAQLENVPAVKSLLPKAPNAPPMTEHPILEHKPMRAGHDVPRASADNQYLGGSPIGMCHGKLSGDASEHAFNFWISARGEVIFIEPQTGEFITLGEGAHIDYVYI